MSAVLERPRAVAGQLPKTLVNGDRLTRSEFHALYEDTPDDFHAELIGGTVFLAPRVTAQHGSYGPVLGTPFLLYENETVGTEACGRVTLLLDDENEPEPDACLRILRQFRGRSHESDDGYLVGPPELVCELAYSGRSPEFHAKKRAYAAAGVAEYWVFNLLELRLHFFDLAEGRELQPGEDGVFRSRTFPGLWIDTAAFVNRDARTLMDCVRRGVETPEHAAFVAELAARRGRPNSGA